GEITGYRGETRYKGQDVVIEAPAHMEVDPESAAGRIAAVRFFQESEQCIVYIKNADGSKTPLSGTDRGNAVRAHFVGENTVNATIQSAVNKSIEFNAKFEAERKDARLEGGVGQAKNVVAKLSMADKGSIKRSIEDGILAPLKAAEEAANTEYVVNLIQACEDFGGNLNTMVTAFEDGQFSKWIVNGVDATENLSGPQKLISNYMELDANIFADRHSKMLQHSASDITRVYKDMFEINPDNGEVQIKADFKTKVGEDFDAGLIDLSINRHLSVESGSYVHQYGFVNPEDVVDALGLMFTPDNMNGIALDRVLKNANNTEVNTILKKIGMSANGVDGKPELSVKKFLEGIKEIGKMLGQAETRPTGDLLPTTALATTDKPVTPYREDL
ncbi:MAG: hypothetical protein ACRC45_04640, partial [Cetobacterium sp.]